MGQSTENRYWSIRQDIIAEHNTQAEADAQRSVEYAQLAVRSAIVLNGGALFVLPAYVGNVLGKVNVNNELLLTAAGCFVVGIFFAVACAFVAYLNFGLHSDEHQYERNAQLNAVDEYFDEFSKIRLASTRREVSAGLATNVSRTRNRIDITWKVGVTAGIISYVLFVAGCVLSGLVMINGI